MTFRRELGAVAGIARDAQHPGKPRLQSYMIYLEGDHIASVTHPRVVAEIATMYGTGTVVVYRNRRIIDVALNVRIPESVVVAQSDEIDLIMKETP